MPYFAGVAAFTFALTVSAHALDRYVDKKKNPYKYLKL